MKYIDLDSLANRLPSLKKEYQNNKPFRYVMFDNFFSDEVAELIYSNYPDIENNSWDGTTYIDQQNKFTKRNFNADSIMNQVFQEFNAQGFIDWLNLLSDIERPLIADHTLYGGGLHQSINGAFLNVHVDYNINPETKLHRRLNVLVYMNKDWHEEYNGAVEFWDLTDGKKEKIAQFTPSFNRCVIFETNEISFHGHPTPLNTPKGINRKSLATYYYTDTRPENEIAKEHNTLYVNTEGISGSMKRLSSGVRALLERINKK